MLHTARHYRRSAVCRLISNNRDAGGVAYSAEQSRFAPLMSIQTIAFYLPQFHPIPENDAWWGRGFTEWTNVSRSVPLFKGHVQPRVPADLGFYDLRLSESREAQAALAREHGIQAFCYYHYWFSGKRLIERPFDEVLRLGRPVFPFCLCWANESWSRRWLGEERDILVAQTYSAEDDINHARWLARAFADSRYVTVGGRPLFLIYRPHDLPDPARTIDVIRDEARRAGVAEPFLVGVDAHQPGRDFRLDGFDSTLNFSPQLGVLPDAFNDGFRLSRLKRNRRLGVFSGTLKLYDYDEAWRAMSAVRPSFPHIPSVFVGWDNTPRRGRSGIVIKNSTPAKFATAFREVVSGVTGEGSAGERIVFINAWNEWAEGNYLEPDLVSQRAFLEVARDVVGEVNAMSRKAEPRCP